MRAVAALGISLGIGSTIVIVGRALERNRKGDPISYALALPILVMTGSLLAIIPSALTDNSAWMYGACAILAVGPGLVWCLGAIRRSGSPA